jgi:FdhD protein
MATPTLQSVLGGLRELDALRVAGNGAAEARRDVVAVEEPLEIRLCGDALATTMRTPGQDQELCAGFLFAEGLIASRDDLGSMAHCGRLGEDGYGNVIDVLPAPGTAFGLERTRASRRGTLTTTACGVCGRRSIDDLIARVGRIDDETRLSREVLRRLGARLRDQQPAFQQSGGLHAAGLADAAGRYHCVREDIGRHNAVDKVIGRWLLDGRLPAGGTLLVVSGRASFEIVHKALCAGVPALVSVSAPSSLAVQTAERGNMTLIGFARDGGFNVYSGGERIAD